MKMVNPTLGIGIYLLLSFLLLGVGGLEGCATVSQSEACKKYVTCLSARDAKLGVSTDANDLRVAEHAGVGLREPICVQELAPVV